MLASFPRSSCLEFKLKTSALTRFRDYPQTHLVVAIPVYLVIPIVPHFLIRGAEAWERCAAEAAKQKKLEDAGHDRKEESEPQPIDQGSMFCRLLIEDPRKH